MTDKELKQQLVNTVTELYNAGLITGKGGNVSVRSVDLEDAVWITPSQIFKGGLKPEQMILVNMEGKRIGGDTIPSVESSYHAGLMRLRPEINSVVHTHAPLATIFGMIDMPILPVTVEAVMIMDFPRLPFLLAGTQELTSAVLNNIGKTKLLGAFLQNHGLITIGKDLKKAAYLTYTVEFALNLLFNIKSLSLQPMEIPEKSIVQLKKILTALD